MEKFKFTPEEGFLNGTEYPNTKSEQENREQLQRPLNQIKTFINDLIDSLTNLLNKKVDVVEGKGLSTNDYTNAEKTKLQNIEANAQKNPTSLKNPYQLTLNKGKESVLYDGSEEKTITIPSFSVDSTLTQSTNAADAKVTGDKISKLERELNARVYKIDCIVDLDGEQSGTIDVGYLTEEGVGDYFYDAEDNLWKIESIESGVLAVVTLCNDVNQIIKNAQDISKIKEDIANQNGSGKGWSSTQIDLLESLLTNVAYKDETTGQNIATSLIASLRENNSSGGDDTPTEATLSSIEATYSGGNVIVGSELTDLASNLVVTGTYSDGSSATVTGYELSGEIVEGTNTITVTYGGLTTTFDVVGYAEESGETETWEEAMVLSYATSTTPSSSNDYIPSTTTNTGYSNACSTNIVEHYGGVLYCDMEANAFTFQMAVIIEDSEGVRYGTTYSESSTNFNITSENQVVNLTIKEDNTAFIANNYNSAGYPFSVVIPDGYKLACIFFRTMSDKANIIAQNGITFTLRSA